MKSDTIIALDGALSLVYQSSELALDALSALQRLQARYTLYTPNPPAGTEEKLRKAEIELTTNRPPESRILCAVSDDPSFFQRPELSSAFPIFILSEAAVDRVAKLDAHIPAFHSLRSAGDWILEHPEPEAYLEEALAGGAAAIRRGELCVFPTETVYGLGADALDEEAVRRIFLAKERPDYDPLIVHIGDLDQLSPLVREMPPKAQLLAERFWPGPLTLVLPKSEAVPDLVTSSHPTVAIRMPSNPYARELIRRAATPVAAPSANLFGRTSPTTAAHVIDQLDGRFQALIDAGACRVGVESTVLSLAGPEPILLRKGGVSREEIEAVIGPIREAKPIPAEAAPSPGMLPSHYAPLTPLEMVADVLNYRTDPEVGVILYEASELDFAGPTVCVSRDRNPSEIAINIYAALRELDSKGLRAIIAEWAPAHGVGAAVNERLKKASAPR